MKWININLKSDEKYICKEKRKEDDKEVEIKEIINVKYNENIRIEKNMK